MFARTQATLPSEVFGIRTSNTSFVCEATQLVSPITPRWLLNDPLSTYIFAESLSVEAGLGMTRRCSISVPLCMISA